jgi:hypothetical protein
LALNERIACKLFPQAIDCAVFWLALHPTEICRVWRDADAPLHESVLACGSSDKNVKWQSVKEFICNHDAGLHWLQWKNLRPSARECAQPCLKFFSAVGVCLNDHDVECREDWRVIAMPLLDCGAQERTCASAKLNPGKRRWHANALPRFAGSARNR